ncbi:MAG: hypothetical protein ACPHUF_11040 [Gammaproteobacteria bacterium]
MPLYEYHCETNGQTVEVVHKMSERYETWGELCAGAEIEVGDTPADTPIQRLIGGGSVNNLNNTLSKKNKLHGSNSKHLHSGPMAAPMRDKNF